MFQPTFFSALLFFALPLAGTAQDFLKGRIFGKGGPEIISGVNVQNLRRRTFSVSDAGGNFRLPAAPGDTIVVSATGFLPDTLFVTESMLSLQRDVDLEPRADRLATVEVDEMALYERDSMQRHADYAWLLEKKHPVKMINEKRPGDGPGFSASPLGFLSTTEKRKRALKARIHEEDEQAYVNLRFARARVSQLTGLRGDSLQQFMQRFTPAVKQLRAMSGQDVLVYINDKLLFFRGIPSPFQ